MRLNKYLFFIVALVLMVIQALSAQVPAGFNYQAAARHSDGSLMVKDQIEVSFTLYDGNTQVWQETYSPKTHK
jgi:Skp family chaperone for outer membrane proteins